MQNITLSNILLKLKRGSINDLPASANEAEPLVTVNADDSRSLYIGTGTAVKPLIDDNMRAKSAFTVYDNSYDSSFHNKFVYFDEVNNIWTKAYTGVSNGKIIKAQGFAQYISAGYLSIVIQGKIQTSYFTDENGNALTVGSSYYLTSNSSNAGLVTNTLTDNNYNQKVFDVLSVNSTNNICELIINCLSDTVADMSDKWHALKAYSDSGKELPDIEGYTDVFKYRHSSFNSASISLVGTPIVSLDGILDKLDNSNSLAKSGLLTISSAYRNFEMLISFTTGSDINSNQYIMRLGCTNSSIYDANAIYISGGKLYGQVATVVNSGIDITADTTYYVKLGWISGSSYIVKCSTDGLNWTEQTINYSTALPAGDYYCYFGRVDDVNFNREFYGQIDLKYANIVINNELFYSCNETGTDTFESNFITVGSPIVSSTGILSGITSGTDYVLTDGALENPQKSLEIYWRGTYYTGSNTLFGTVNAFSCGILNGNTIRLYNANGITTFDCLIGGVLSDDDLLNVYVKLTATSVYLEVTTKFGTVNNSTTGTYTLNALDVMGIGSTNTGTYPWLGTVDLNGFKVIIDGDSLYQAYLAVPYVKSSSKSKIVNVFYSARLADVYKFYGLAEYYTIDEANQTFALPYGEIYGFMASKENLANKTNILSESEIEYPSCAAVSNALKALNFNTKYAINSGNLDSNGEPDIIATNSTQQQVPYGQPVLTQNGTPGVSNLAVAWYYNDTTTSMTTAYNTSASYPTMHPYKMFDGVMDVPTHNTGYVQLRYANQLRLTFNTPVCLTQFKQFNMTDSSDYYSGIIKASNDNGSTWTTIHTFTQVTATTTVDNGAITVSFPSNTNQYSVYEIEMTDSQWTEALIPCWPVTEMQLTGTVTSGTGGSLIYYNVGNRINSDLTNISEGIFNNPGTYTINLASGGNFPIEAVSGGGYGARVDGGIDSYNDTAWSFHYGYTGASGAYFKGTIHLDAGNHTIQISEPTNDKGASGSTITIDDSFTLTGGANGNIAGDTWSDITRSGGSLIVSSSITATDTYNVGNVGVDAGVLHNSTDITQTGVDAPVPSGLSAYGCGGGLSHGTKLAGGNAYLKLTLGTFTYLLDNAPQLILTDAKNNQLTRFSIESKDVTSMADGTYNVLVDETTEDYLKSNLYYQSVAPSSPSTGDVFVNIAVEPLQVQKYSGTVWEDYNKIPIGQFTVSSGTVDASSILTFPFNMNGTVSKLCEDYENSGNGYHIEWRFDSHTHRFRKYCEQWGTYSVNDSIVSGDYAIALSNNYADVSYNAEASYTSTATTTDIGVVVCIKSIAVSGFTVALNNAKNAQVAIGNIYWHTSGYLN